MSGHYGPRGWTPGTPPYDDEMNRVIPRGCDYWQRRMFARLKQTDKKHVTCGKPWADHGDLGECP